MKRSNIEHERIFFPVEYHFLAEPNSEHGGIVEGYGSTFGHPLENGVIVDAGSFKKTIAERVKRPGGSIVPYFDNHQWDGAHLLGTVVDASEDSRGLLFKAQLSKAPSVQDVYTKIKEGHIKLNSIGFDAVRENYQPDTIDGRTIKRRHLLENKLWEISAVPLAMDPQADITRVHGLVPFQDLPIAPRDHKWNYPLARAHLVSWAKSGDEMNWAKFRRAFLSFDPANPDDIDSYKMPIADVIEGELMAVPAAIDALGPWASREGSAAERERLERYYAKMAEEFHDDSIVPPWKKVSIDTLLVDAKKIGRYDLGDIRKAASEFFGILKPEDRKQLLAELSAGPATKPPTEGTSDSGALDKAEREAFGARLTRIGSTVSELRRRVT